MTRKHHSIDQLSSVSLRQAQNEMAMMQRDLNKLRDNITGLHRSIHAPHIKTPRTKTKKTTTPAMNFFGVSVGSLANSVVEDVLGGSVGGYISATQSAGQKLAMIALGQRTR